MVQTNQNIGKSRGQKAQYERPQNTHQMCIHVPTVHKKIMS